MEPVPHTGPLRDPAGATMEPLIHQSPCIWQETDPRGTIPPGRLEPRWLTGQEGEGEDRDRWQVGAFTDKLQERGGLRVCECACVVLSLRYNNREHLCNKTTSFSPPSFLTQTLQQCSVIVWPSFLCVCVYVCERVCVLERDTSMELKGDFMVLS